MKSIIERFWEKVEKTETCWIWTASRSGGSGGEYGQFRITSKSSDRNALAHRVSYEWAKGPIPPGMQIDHLCKNKLCVNPDHLEAVTLIENVLRGESSPAVNKRKRFCKRGHEYTEENTYTHQKGKRACQTCRKAATARSRTKRKA